ncbi:hypothetical protein [Carp edema virus]|nr:hypothetical protein [Carp edema virus]
MFSRFIFKPFFISIFNEVLKYDYGIVNSDYYIFIFFVELFYKALQKNVNKSNLETTSILTILRAVIQDMRNDLKVLQNETNEIVQKIQGNIEDDFILLQRNQRSMFYNKRRELLLMTQVDVELINTFYYVSFGIKILPENYNHVLREAILKNLLDDILDVLEETIVNTNYEKSMAAYKKKIKLETIQNYFENSNSLKLKLFEMTILHNQYNFFSIDDQKLPRFDIIFNDMDSSESTKSGFLLTKVETDIIYQDQSYLISDNPNTIVKLELDNSNISNAIIVKNEELTDIIPEVIESKSNFLITLYPIYLPLFLIPGLDKLELDFIYNWSKKIYKESKFNSNQTEFKIDILTLLYNVLIELEIEDDVKNKIFEVFVNTYLYLDFNLDVNSFDINKKIKETLSIDPKEEVITKSEAGLDVTPITDFDSKRDSLENSMYNIISKIKSGYKTHVSFVGNLSRTKLNFNIIKPKFNIYKNIDHTKY